MSFSPQWIIGPAFDYLAKPLDRCVLSDELCKMMLSSSESPGFVVEIYRLRGDQFLECPAPSEPIAISQFVIGDRRLLHTVVVDRPVLFDYHSLRKIR